MKIRYTYYDDICKHMFKIHPYTKTDPYNDPHFNDP